METVGVVHSGTVGSLTGTARLEVGLVAVIVVVGVAILIARFLHNSAHRRRMSRGTAYFDSTAAHYGPSGRNVGSPRWTGRPDSHPQDGTMASMAASITAPRRHLMSRPTPSDPTARPRTSTTRPGAPSSTASTGAPTPMVVCQPAPVAPTGGTHDALPLLPPLPPVTRRS